MAQLTREQAIKWNDGNVNGFQFDPQYYVFHGEKTSLKKISIGDNKYLYIHLMYRETYQNYIASCQPVAHFAVYYNQGSVMVSHGLGYWHNMGDATAKKNYNALKSLSALLNDENCLEIFETLQKTKVNQLA